jgi:hypothetical protein
VGAQRGGFDRRRFLRGAVVAGGAAWVAPTVTTLQPASAAELASPPPERPHEHDPVERFPAAPAVAAAILAEHGVRARYGSGATGGNHIADVAAEMTKTPGTDFQGVAKEDVASYEAKVRAFLVANGAIS